MNDKEKQIREIAKVIMEAIQGETHLVKPANVFEAAAEATALYNANCRIIPEDSIVVKKSVLKEELRNLEIQARKETAMEIYQWLKEHTFDSSFAIIEIYFKEQYGVIGEE